MKCSFIYKIKNHDYIRKNVMTMEILKNKHFLNTIWIIIMILF